jgi:hypothetical protein
MDAIAPSAIGISRLERIVSTQWGGVFCDDMLAKGLGIDAVNMLCGPRHMLLRRLFCVVLAALCGCAPLEKPATREVVHLFGSPYDRGLQHGEKLKSKVHSFFTTLLTNSLFPYLGREQPDISSFLPEYQAERYQNGHFAFELLLDSAKNIEKSLPRATRDELRGVADGSGLSYDEVLVLNTFVDTVLAVRGIALAIRLGRAPQLERIEALGAEADGVDNDADGQTDEMDEAVIAPWIPELRASWVELPTNVKFKLTLRDPDGISASTLRISLGGTLYTEGSPGLSLSQPAADVLEATLTPPEGLPAASDHTLVISAGVVSSFASPAEMTRVWSLAAGRPSGGVSVASSTTAAGWVSESPGEPSV